MQIDRVDQQIISILQQDGRTSNYEMAGTLKVSEGTVRNRIRKLSESGVLAVKGLVNPEKVDGKQMIFLGAKVAVSSDLEKAAGAISKLKDVKSVCVVAGRYDLLIELFVAPGKMMSFISGPLASTGTVISTESFVGLKCYRKWV